MKVEQIVIYRISLRLKEPFSTSLGSFQERSPILVEVRSEGLSGWGEASSLPFPYYNHEDTSTVWHMLKTYICPLIIKEQPQSAESINAILSKIVGNHTAKAGIEMAYWDLTAKRLGLPLYRLLGGTKTEIQSGVVIPNLLEVSKTLERIQTHIAEGYKRVKLKVSRGKELSLLQSACSRFPSSILSFDANGAYCLNDLNLLKEVDSLNLQMIEQPFKGRNFADSAILQANMQTAICLDESVENLSDAQLAIKLGSCKIMNLKPSRLGGLQDTLAVHALTKSTNVAAFCGGMLETGIGRAHSMATASLPNYLYAADLSESRRYYEEDIVEPEIRFFKPGILKLSENPGIGVEVRRSEVERRALETLNFRV